MTDLDENSLPSRDGRSNSFHHDNDDDEFLDERPSLFEDSLEETNDEARTRAIARTHYRCTAALCCCTFTHSWLLVSVFPYSAFMVIFLVRGDDEEKGTTTTIINEENAGTYAGLLAASFMVGRAFTAYGWGSIGDVYGRRIVFFLSLWGSCLCSVLFGTATTFGGALLWRFLLGASNGIAGISKTVVTETARGIEKLETRGMSSSMGMWAWGFLLSPGISGFLADPVKQYPEYDFPPFWKGFLQEHPFLLPNLVSMVLCTIDFWAVWFLVPETLPSPRSWRRMPKDCYEWFANRTTRRILRNKQRNNDITTTNSTRRGITDIETTSLNGKEEEESGLLLGTSSSIELTPTKRCETNGTIGKSGTRCRSNSSGTTTTTTDSTDSFQPPPATLRSIWTKRDTRNHLIVFWIFSFVGIAIDEAFPLFCISKEGGLGLDEGRIGKLLSATGVFFAISQYKASAWIVDRYGVHKSIRIGALLSAPLAAFVPLSILLNHHHQQQQQQQQQDLTWAAFWYLALLLGFIRIFGLVFFSNITIATNRTVRPEHRGTMNGLSMLGGSIAKSLGPIAAGLLSTFAMSSDGVDPRVGAVLVFGVIGASSAAIAWITVCLLGGDNDDDNDNDDGHHHHSNDNNAPIAIPTDETLRFESNDPEQAESS